MTEFPLSSTTAADDAHFEASSSSSSSSPSHLPHPSSNPTLSYWLTTSSPPSSRYGVYSGSDIADDLTVSVAIIGSGITGVSLAYHLLQHPQLATSYINSIAVFEAREFCSGATGRNGGHLTPVSALAYLDLASNPAHLSRHIDATDSTLTETTPQNRTDNVIRRILTLEQRTATDLITLVQEATLQKQRATDGDKDEEWEDVQLANKKNWHVCFSAAEEVAFEASLEAATQAGLSDFVRLIRKVSKEECDQALNRPVDVQCAFEIPGSTLHPRRLVALLWRLAFRRSSACGKDRQVSLEMYTHTPIERISYPHSVSPSSTSTLHTVQGQKIQARFVIHATNAYVSHLAPQLAGPKHGIVPTRAQCIAALPAATQTWEMGISLHSGYEYLHQRPLASPPSSPSASAGEGKNMAPPPPLIFGGGRYLSDTMEYGISDDGSVHPTISHFLRSYLPSTFPRTFSSSSSTSAVPLLAPVSHEWTGIIGMSRSKDPLVGPLPALSSSPFSSQDEAGRSRVKQHYVSAGYSGHGMTRAFACAQIIADMVLADDRGQLGKWTVPDWFPACYLTMLPSAPV
ncbi:hypothetical protein A4X09_0g2954 [Tilletia walkeri]|uniref:FAD dependent oxidoreductase domain-containing protein n=1 Tax=Tilletia walkeri TaxID=117179 RepID=A0A8X7NBD0_9BASI|nr:hypothetical protein A4X09_0g2954 [Tilletia walkeri]